MHSARRWRVLAGFLLASFATSAVGGAFTASSVQTWYPTLAKPAWTPPSWLFGPVWSVLYAAMAVAVWLAWERVRGTPEGRTTVALFFVQLALNAAWSALFFGARRPDLALLDLAALAGLVLLLAFRLWRHRPAAGALWLPYAAWTTFALALNFALWQMNS